jgi:hypothetical protein
MMLKSENVIASMLQLKPDAMYVAADALVHTAADAMTGKKRHPIAIKSMVAVIRALRILTSVN